MLTGAQSPAEACRKHTLSPSLLGLCKATFLERAHTLFQPDDQRDEDQARIAELEQLLGRATRQIESLKKLGWQSLLENAVSPLLMVPV